MNPSITTHIEIRPNRVGQNRAYVAGTRVRVLDIYVMSELQGLSPDEIVDGLPHLTLAQVHAALAYFFDHRDEIVGQLHEEAAAAERLKAMFGAGPLAGKLLSPATDETGDDSVSS